jgi:glycosyltransferase involved in cell wall biosynthesis
VQTHPAPYSVARTRRATIAPPDLIVFSHLRWSWVWQRPQHLIARLARHRRVWFVEEPMCDSSVDRPELRWIDEGPVTVVRAHVPGPERHIGFDSAEAADLGRQVADATGGDVDTVWLYTPLALPAARMLTYRTMVFDVMDDLASFKGASSHLPTLHREAVTFADVVLAGGRSLHEGVLEFRNDAYLFPSGVDADHYAEAVLHRNRPGVPVAGYVGVIDERIDLDLIDRLADRLPNWQIMMVGPLAKITADDLPRRDNICYPGRASYEELPAAMSSFHVALMPFAHNSATRRISPTKTLEYLAAGLPVVSTSVPDVVADYSHVVRIADDPDAFASACTDALGDAHDSAYHEMCRPLLEWNDWNRIAARIEQILSRRPMTARVDMDATA